MKVYQEGVEEFKPIFIKLESNEESEWMASAIHSAWLKTTTSSPREKFLFRVSLSIINFLQQFNGHNQL